MTTLILRSTVTSIPIEVSLSERGTGGITGESPVYRLRRVSDGYYLDFDDNTFKNSAWTTKQKPLTENGAHSGFYSDTLDATSVPLPNGFKGIIEYANAGDEAFISEDVLIIRN